MWDQVMSRTENATIEKDKVSVWLFEVPYAAIAPAPINSDT